MGTARAKDGEVCKDEDGVVVRAAASSYLFAEVLDMLMIELIAWINCS